MITISVLMATYAKEKPERLRKSLESVFKQSRPVEQIVLVIDGPVPVDQEKIIDEYLCDQRIADMQVVRLPVNGGLAEALNAGLSLCSGDYIMRMDTDDISMGDRAELQAAYAEEHPEVDVISAWTEEFSENSPVTRIRSSPINHHAIGAALKWRNVIAHASLFVKRSALQELGGYRSSYPFLEDWDLYVRLFNAQARFGAIPKILVRLLTDADQARRRGGVRYLINEVRFRTYCWRTGFLKADEYTLSTIAYGMFRIAGPTVRAVAYRIVRKQGLDAGSVQEA